MAMRHFAITQRGESHIRLDTVCQDYSGVRSVELPKMECNCVVAAISDGVGSCLYSDEGSRLAVTTVLEFLETRLPEMEEIRGETVLPELRAAYQAALDVIDKHSREENKPLLELDCTLTTVVLMDDGRAFYGHIGDDGAVAMYEDGASELLTKRHKGAESNSVYPLPFEDMWEFGESEKPVASVALMTDGVLDKAVGDAIHGNRVYLPMIKTALTFPMSDEEAAQRLREHWHNYLLDPSFRKMMPDDITLVTVQRPEAVAALPEVEFDQAEWDAMTEAEKERVRRVLQEESDALHRELEERGTVMAFEELEGDDADLMPQLVGMPMIQSADVQEAGDAQPEPAATENEPAAEAGDPQTQPADAAPDPANDGSNAPAGNSTPQPAPTLNAPSTGSSATRPAPTMNAPTAGNSATRPAPVMNAPSAGSSATRPTPQTSATQPSPSAPAAGAAIFGGLKRFVQGIQDAARRTTTAPAPQSAPPVKQNLRRVLTGASRRQYNVGRTLIRMGYGLCCEVDGDPNVLLVLLNESCFGSDSSRTSRSALSRRMQALCQNVHQRRQGEPFGDPQPCDVVSDERGQFAGYVIDCPDNNVHMIEQVWRERGPGQYYGLWQFRDWVYVAIQLAAMVMRIHRQGMCVFDFDPQNFMVRNGAEVGMLRMDRICFVDKRNLDKYQPCSGRTDMLPPEILVPVMKKEAVPFSAETDAFSFAILLYMLLSGGRHPFDTGAGADVVQNILAGRSVYNSAPSLDRRPPALPLELDRLFRSAFDYSEADAKAGKVASRPSVQDWLTALQAARHRG